MILKFIKRDSLKKYLLYAIGEILLIAIGVLLAIQFNNWNDKRKSNIQALEHLQGIGEDLKMDTLFLGMIARMSKDELYLLANRLNKSSYESLPLDTLNSYVINSFITEYKINNKSYQKILNLGLPKVSKNAALESHLDVYYNSLGTRLKTFIDYDYDQTNFEHEFWFYDQNMAEMFLAPTDPFPFTQTENERKKGLINLFNSVKARNYMRSEYYRTEQMIEFVEYVYRAAKLLLEEIESEVSVKNNTDSNKDETNKKDDAE